MFSKVFNQVFVNEKPDIIHSYSISEVQIVELIETRNFQQKLVCPFNLNFTQGTSREIKYLQNDQYKNFLLKAIKNVKTFDKASQLSQVDLHNRGRKTQGS